MTINQRSLILHALATSTSVILSGPEFATVETRLDSRESAGRSLPPRARVVFRQNTIRLHSQFFPA
jgi:hypothetical protein